MQILFIFGTLHLREDTNYLLRTPSNDEYLYPTLVRTSEDADFLLTTTELIHSFT